MSRKFLGFLLAKFFPWGYHDGMNYLKVLSYASVFAQFMLIAQTNPDHKVMVEITFDPANKKFAFKPVLVTGPVIYLNEGM